MIWCPSSVTSACCGAAGGTGTGSARCGGGHRALIAQLESAGETHGDSEGLRVVDLDVEAERRLQAGVEEVHFLGLRERASAGEQSLELVLVLDDRTRAFAHCELTERIGAQGRPEMGV